MEKHSRLAVLEQQWQDCRSCALSLERKNVVFGYGNPDAQILVIGEAPGANEDNEGIPFVGQAGMLLDQYLMAVSIRPELKQIRSKDGLDHKFIRETLLQDIYYTNIVACHPPENRDPAKEEINACRSRLNSIIYLVDPVIIVSVGKLAVETLLGRKVNITSIHGEVYDVQVPGYFGPVTYPVMAVLHPSYLLRNGDLSGPMATKTFNNVLEVFRIMDHFDQLTAGTPRPKDRPKPEKL